MLRASSHTDRSSTDTDTDGSTADRSTAENDTASTDTGASVDTSVNDTAIADTMESGAGVPHGQLLVDFTTAAVAGHDLTALRRQLVAAVGPEAAAQAVATVAAFTGYVRVAESTGIPVDDGLAAASGTIRRQLELDRFAGAANSPRRDRTSGSFTTVDALWRHDDG